MPKLWTGPSVLVAREADDDRYFDATTEDRFHKAALALLTERANDELHGWYDGAPALWKKQMQMAISTADGDWAWRQLVSRSKFEYEGVSLELFETI